MFIVQIIDTFYHHEKPLTSIEKSINPNLMKRKITLLAMILISINTFAATTCPTPTIPMNPFPVSVCTGHGTIFSIMANGTGLTYQWQVDSGTGFTDLSNSPPYGAVTSNLLNISFLTAEMAANMNLYRCVVTDSCSQVVVSSSASLTVHSSPIATATVTGSTVTVSATGGTPPYTGTGIFSNIMPGYYPCEVMDANGCMGLLQRQS